MVKKKFLIFSITCLCGLTVTALAIIIFHSQIICSLSNNKKNESIVKWYYESAPSSFSENTIVYCLEKNEAPQVQYNTIKIMNENLQKMDYASLNPYIERFLHSDNRALRNIALVYFAKGKGIPSESSLVQIYTIYSDRMETDENILFALAALQRNVSESELSNIEQVFKNNNYRNRLGFSFSSTTDSATQSNRRTTTAIQP